MAVPLSHFGRRAAPVAAPFLLIVGVADREVLELNQRARSWMARPDEFAVVPGATHLFEEPGALEQDARPAAAAPGGDWSSGWDAYASNGRSSEPCRAAACRQGLQWRPSSARGRRASYAALPISCCARSA